MYGKYSPPVTPPMSPVSMGSYTQTQSLTQSPASKSRQNSHTNRHSASAKRFKYLRRIFHFRQMDFEYAIWQMLYLFISPQKVYRNFSYRKETKDQWARDDPAFLVLLSLWLFVSSIVFAIVLGLGFFGFFKFLFWVIFVDCIGVGLLLASAMWLLTNRYMIMQPPRGQDVEWGFCFDIHLNAFFPLLIILHFFQLPLINFINGDSFFGRLLGNTFWLVAIGYYIYITFLGFSTLPFLKKTQMFLYPMTLIVLLYILAIVIGWNFTAYLCSFYATRAFY